MVGWASGGQVTRKARGRVGVWWAGNQNGAWSGGRPVRG